MRINALSYFLLSVLFLQATWSQLSADGATLDCASNLSGDRFATSTLDGRQAYVQVRRIQVHASADFPRAPKLPCKHVPCCALLQVWEPDSSSGDWNLVSQVSVSVAGTSFLGKVAWPLGRHCRTCMQTLATGQQQLVLLVFRISMP